MSNTIRIALLLCCFLPVHVHAQTGWRWGIQGGGILFDETAMDAVTDDSGNVYFAAFYEDGAFFLDSIFHSEGASDLIVAKLDAHGRLQWLDRRGGTAPDRANGLFLGADGSLFMTGYGKISFPQRHTRDALVARYRSDGSLAWGRYMDGDQFSEGWKVVADASLNSYMGGTLKINGWFGQDTLYGHGGKDAYFSKFDSAGTHLLSMTIGGTGDDEGRAMGIDAQGNVYICGYFSGTAHFGGGLSRTSLGQTDGFIAKYSPAGQLAWAKQIGGTQLQDVKALTVAEDGSVYFAGDFSGTMTTQVGTFTSVDFYDVFYGKLGHDGSFHWIKTAGGPNMQLAQDIEVDQEENLYIGGLFFGSMSFDTLTVSSGLYDNLYWAKLDSAGDPILVQDAYFPQDGRGIAGLCVDRSQNVTACGYFSQELILGTDTLNSIQASKDFFVGKFATMPYALLLDSVTGSPLCGGDRFEAHYSVLGMPAEGNVFHLELSDGSGGWSQPDTVGSLTTPTGGVILATVPVGLPFGTGYRLRVAGSAPGILSNDNGQDLLLDPATSVAVEITGDSVICNGVPVLLLVSAGLQSQVWSTGDTTNFLIIQVPGTYWVEGTDPNGCTNRDEHVVTTCVGSDDPLSEARLQVWPNPAEDLLKLRTEVAVEVTMTDLAGRAVVTGFKAGPGFESIPCAHLPRGAYVLSAKEPGRATYFRKVILR